MNKALIAFTIFLVVSCGIQFEQTALYDEYEAPAEEEKAAQIIFEDGAGTMWNSLFECGSFEIVKDVYYAGNSSIKISWDKGKGCEWIGFGNSFSNWAPTNVAEYQNEKALSFYVRTQENTAGAIPIVLGLEDFSGGGTYLFTDTKKYLYGLEIDTTWTQMIVPMWHFPIGNEAENDDIDITSVKQLKFQLEGAGSFYLDEIKLIDYSKEEYDKMLADVEAMKPKGNLNQIVYREGQFDFDAHGVGEKICHTLNEVTDSIGNTYISWKYNPEDCNWATWGINWNDWYPVNFRGIVKDAKLQFKLKTSSSAKFKIQLTDFKGHSSELFSSFSVSDDESEWEIIDIPLSNFELDKKDFQLDLMREIKFIGMNAGEVHIDDIKIMDKWEY